MSTQLILAYNLSMENVPSPEKIYNKSVSELINSAPKEPVSKESLKAKAKLEKSLSGETLIIVGRQLVEGLESGEELYEIQPGDSPESILRGDQR